MPYLSKRGDVLKILIVGAGIVAYGCAYSALKEGHEVHIVDHAIEFGLPNVWPSVLLSRESIPLSFSTEQGFEGSDSAFRHEWIMKGMNIELARLGVRFCHRTRIVSEKTEDGQFNVNFIGAGQFTDSRIYDKLIDTTQDTWIPWAKPHEITEATSSYNIERKEATGYVHLKDQSHDFKNPIYQIHRQDGLSESWYIGNHKSENRKTIEIISTMLPFNHTLWDCSQRFQSGMELWNGM